jgi:hypothetical protein
MFDTAYVRPFGMVLGWLCFWFELGVGEFGLGVDWVCVGCGLDVGWVRVGCGLGEGWAWIGSRLGLGWVSIWCMLGLERTCTGNEHAPETNTHWQSLS